MNFLRIEVRGTIARMNRQVVANEIYTTELITNCSQFGSRLGRAQTPHAVPTLWLDQSTGALQMDVSAFLKSVEFCGNVFGHSVAFLHLLWKRKFWNVLHDQKHFVMHFDSFLSPFIRSDSACLCLLRSQHTCCFTGFQPLQLFVVQNIGVMNDSVAGGEQVRLALDAMQAMISCRRRYPEYKVC